MWIRNPALNYTDVLGKLSPCGSKKIIVGPDKRQSKVEYLSSDPGDFNININFVHRSIIFKPSRERVYSGGGGHFAPCVPPPITKKISQICLPSNLISEYAPYPGPKKEFRFGEWLGYLLNKSTFGVKSYSSGP